MTDAPETDPVLSRLDQIIALLTPVPTPIDGPVFTNDALRALYNPAPAEDAV